MCVCEQAQGCNLASSGTNGCTHDSLMKPLRHLCPRQSGANCADGMRHTMHSSANPESVASDRVILTCAHTFE